MELFTSFKRQLNMYDFNKCKNKKSSCLEFKHQYFKRDQFSLLHRIIRKTHSLHPNNLAVSLENRIANDGRNDAFGNYNFQSLPEYQVLDTNGQYQIRPQKIHQQQQALNQKDFSENDGFNTTAQEHVITNQGQTGFQKYRKLVNYDQINPHG